MSTYAYDAADSLVRTTYPSGRIVDYQRDALGRAIAVTTRKSAAAPDVAIAANITYRPFGPIASLVHGNGHITTFTHDQDYRLTGLVTGDGTTAVQDLGYTYDPASNITAIADNLDPALDQGFGYDALDRLTGATGDYGALAYGYDPVGNRVERTVDAGTPEVLTYAAISNRLQSVTQGAATRTLAYTANGNLELDSRDGGLAFVYGDDNRLVRVTDQAGMPNTIALYAHNDLGQRVSKTVGTTVTHFHYDRRGAPIAESDAAGAVAREYVHYVGLDVSPVTDTASRFGAGRAHGGRAASSALSR